jgi:hypothetical protein
MYLPKLDLQTFVTIVRWAVFTNAGTRCVMPSNAKHLLNFVEAFDTALTECSQRADLKCQGLNLVSFAEDFSKNNASSRVFHHTSAAAAIMHFSVHRLHLVTFAKRNGLVHLWVVRDVVSSVFDYLCEMQGQEAEAAPSPLRQDFLAKCIALSISDLGSGGGEWLAKRLAVIGQVAVNGKVLDNNGAQFTRTLAAGFDWHCALFEKGSLGSVGNFVDLFLRRNQQGVGRPSKMMQYPLFLDSLEETIVHLSGIAADSRVKAGVSFKARGSNASAKHYAAHLKTKYGIFLSRSTVLTYLRPRNIASLAARRHSPFALAVRPVFDAKAVAKQHVNCHYCCSAVKAMMLLAQSPTFRMETFCLSIDAKAHVKTGNNVRATVRPVKAWMTEEAKKNYVVADHDFLALKKFCLILNGFFSISPFEEHGNGDVIRKGQVAYVVRPWEFRPDSAIQQLDDFLLSLSNMVGDAAQLASFLLGRDFLKLVEISDGGPSTKPSNSLVRITAAFVFYVFSLDLLVRRTNSPETSKLNPVERCHSVVSQSLGGTIPNEGGDEAGMYGAARTVCEKMLCPGLTFSGSPVIANAWGCGDFSFVPSVLRDFANATPSQQRQMYEREVELSEPLLAIVEGLGRPKPRAGFRLRDLVSLISDGRHGSASSVDSTISRCNDAECRICGGLWQGKMWVLTENGSLPMPVPSDVPGRYLPLADLLLSTLADGSQPSWRPSDLIAEAIHGVAFLRGLHDLTLESLAFLEVFIFAVCCVCFSNSRLQLAAHCCAESVDSADFLLAEFQRMLGLHLKRCGLDDSRTLQCSQCRHHQPCLTVAYCSECDSNMCASPREDETSFTGRRCFEVHCVGPCNNAVPAFPRIGCLDIDWSRLRIDGKIQDSSVKVVREMLIQKLKVECKWKAQFKHLKKPQLLRKVLKLVNRNEFEKL